MTVTLTVRTALWRSHIARLVNDVDGLVPVVKGNGYGFGRRWLAELAAEFSDTVAVGTVHELRGLPTGLHAVVLTPTLSAPPAIAGAPPAVLTVANPEHVSALTDAPATGDDRRPVLVKLTSSMQRYGRSVDLVTEAQRGGLDVVGVSIHPPLAGTVDDHVADITAHLPRIDPSMPVWVSHLDPAAAAALPATHTYRLRLGTMLWHGDRSLLHLSADVLDVRPIDAGSRAGYRLGRVPGAGHLVMVGAGTANGVTTLPDGRSPFHFARRRLDLLEPPHMHTSMVFVAAGEPVPAIGDRIDVQRPLTMTTVDEFEWL